MALTVERKKLDTPSLSLALPDAGATNEATAATPDPTLTGSASIAAPRLDAVGSSDSVSRPKTAGTASYAFLASADASGPVHAKTRGTGQIGAGVGYASVFGAGGARGLVGGGSSALLGAPSTVTKTAAKPATGAPTDATLKADPAFKKLPPGIQAEVSARMVKHAGDPAARANYARLATDPAFLALSPEHQKLALEALDKSPADAKLAGDVLTLIADPTFRKLDSGTASDVLKRMARTNAAERASYLKLATTPGFALLNRKHQSEMLNVLDQKPGDAALAADLAEAADSNDFRLNSDPAKSEVIAGLGRLKNDAAARRTLLDVAKSPGLRGMKTEGSMAILRLAGGTSDAYSKAARAELKGIVTDPGFKASGGAAQTARLAKFLEEQKYLPHATTAPAGTFKATKPKITGPTTVPGSKDKVYGVEIDGRTIKVTVKPTPPGMKHHSIDEIATGLAAIPKDTRDKITEVELADGPHAVYPGAYAASNSSGKVWFYPSATRTEDTNFMASALIHEMGHAISGKKWGDDTSDPRWNAWKTAMAKDAISPSEYGHTTAGKSTTAGGGSPYADDFAESWLLYQRVKGTPQEAEMRRLFPERFKIMDTM